MTEPHDNRAENIDVVDRFLAAFTRRWPTEDELAALVALDVVFVQRPNLLSPAGSTSDAAAMRDGIAQGRELLAWQAYAVRATTWRAATPSSRGCAGRASWRSTRDRGPPGRGWRRGASATTVSRRAGSCTSSSTTATRQPSAPGSVGA